MKKKKQISPIECISDEVFKSSLFFKDGKYYLRNSISPLFIPHLREAINEDIEIRYFDSDIKYCPVCGKKFSLNETVESKINKLKGVRMQQYTCSNPNCNETHYTKLTMKNNSQISSDLQRFALEIMLIEGSSFERISEMIEIFTRVKISRQSILNYVIDNENDFFK
jgi:hypothetical protein